ncbi:MAG: S41 family peptidase [Salinivirgaceae bacterium]|nr:S41 family peptidase [Salinivirgaceae bacterium]
MRKIFLLFALIPIFIHAQDCDCESSFEWLKKTFEQNDAGYPMVIKQKGQRTYEKFSDSIGALTKRINNHKECVVLLDEWVHFFRKGHVGVYYIDDPTKTDLRNSIGVENYDAETFAVDTAVFYTQLKQRKIPFKLVDVWYDNSCKIAVVPDTINPQRDYVGVIISTKRPNWKPGQVKVEFFNADSGINANYYMADHSVRKCNVEYSVRNLKVGSFSWRRSLEYVPLKERDDLSIYLAKEPVMKRLNDESLLLRIPSFRYEYKNKIADLLKENEDLLEVTENLVIDVRGNGGGADASMMRIIPYIYTNPVAMYDIEIRSTPLTYEAYKEWFSRSFFGRLYFAISLKRKLKKNMGSYVSRSKDTVRIKDWYNVRDYPKNVYVLVDGKCASTTEQFLLYAEQSSKTTIIGETTFGAIDVSNVNPILFPNKKYRLSYTCSRSLRMHERIIDDIGIDPDIFIPDSIPKFQWLRYVEENIVAD